MCETHELASAPVLVEEPPGEVGDLGERHGPGVPSLEEHPSAAVLRRVNGHKAHGMRFGPRRQAALKDIGQVNGCDVGGADEAKVPVVIFIMNFNAEPMALVQDQDSCVWPVSHGASGKEALVAK